MDGGRDRQLAGKRVSFGVLKNYGPVAQLVERLVRNEEASGSNPLRSTCFSN